MSEAPAHNPSPARGQGYATQGFLAKVMDREQRSPTAFGGQFAIPHALHMDARKTGISVLVSASPDRRGGSQVRLVLMFAVSLEGRPVFRNVLDELIDVLNNPTHIATLLDHAPGPPQVRPQPPRPAGRVSHLGFASNLTVSASSLASMAGERGSPWTSIEIEVVVESYFRMLRAHLTEQPYVKLRENELVQRRTRRSHGSVERKFQNISAVLMELGAGDFVRGYVPLRNAQQALRDAVSDRWRREPDIEALMRATAEQPIPAPRADLIWSARPRFTVEPSSIVHHRSPVRTDFLKLDAENRTLGLAGERAVVALERQSLRRRGLDRLARQVEHVSQTQGDGLGFDVLSFAPDGREKYIEVKTTRKQKEFPFLVTRNEIDFSSEETDHFHLYRVFDFDRPKPGVFAIQGALDATCQLTPTVYTAQPNPGHAR